MSGIAATIGDFADLGQVGPVRFQGGVIFLQGYGCPGCGNGFWTEADSKRRLDAARDACRCPHCGEARRPLA
jgi:DNA-directed RNA polymerase subunit RPC12/RpoP